MATERQSMVLDSPRRRTGLPGRIKQSRSSRCDTKVGTIHSINADGFAMVELNDNAAAGPMQARSTVPVTMRDCGREAVIAFENGDLRRPIILGLLQNPVSTGLVDVHVDGDRQVIEAQNEIVLR